MGRRSSKREQAQDIDPRIINKKAKNNKNNP
jgi:hypothetical protein